MSSWGATDADEAKPKFLTTAQKRDTYATSKGWVYKDPNTGLEEVLVAIGELSGAAKLNIADITSVVFGTTSFSAATGGNIDVTVVFNEKVTVDTSGGTPTLAITNDQTGGGTAASIAASYQSGSSTNKLTFRATIGAAAGDVADTDVLSIADQSVALNSGTMVDAEAVNVALAIAGVTDTLTVEA
jgi:hypothetical protein